jgi:hypothetical protein
MTATRFTHEVIYFIHSKSTRYHDFTLIINFAEQYE